MAKDSMLQETQDGASSPLRRKRHMQMAAERAPDGQPIAKVSRQLCAICTEGGQKSAAGSPGRTCMAKSGTGALCNAEAGDPGGQ